jgi:hypothetical protein
LPISPKIARERSVLFAMEANSAGLLSGSPLDGAIASADDSNTNAAAIFPRAANWPNLALRFLVMGQ